MVWLFFCYIIWFESVGLCDRERIYYIWIIYLKLVLSLSKGDFIISYYLGWINFCNCFLKFVKLFFLSYRLLKLCVFFVYFFSRERICFFGFFNFLNLVFVDLILSLEKNWIVYLRIKLMSLFKWFFELWLFLRVRWMFREKILWLMRFFLVGIGIGRW